MCTWHVRACHMGHYASLVMWHVTGRLYKAIAMHLHILRSLSQRLLQHVRCNITCRGSQHKSVHACAKICAALTAVGQLGASLWCHGSAPLSVGCWHQAAAPLGCREMPQSTPPKPLFCPKSFTDKWMRGLVSRLLPCSADHPFPKSTDKPIA